MAKLTNSLSKIYLQVHYNIDIAFKAFEGNVKEVFYHAM